MENLLTLITKTPRLGDYVHVMEVGEVEGIQFHPVYNLEELER